MFQIEPIDPPEEVAHAGGIAILTHKATLLRVDPRSDGDALVVREMKGFLVDGKFQDWGEHTLHAMDGQGLQEMLADTTGGKPAGVFRTTDVLPAIERRKAAVEAEREAREAEEAARQESARQALPRGPRVQEPPVEG